MSLTLTPMLAPQHKLRLWAGLLASGRPAQPAWTLGGNPAQPRWLRAWAPVQPGLPSDTPRVWCGVAEFDVAAGSHQVTAHCAGMGDGLTVSTLPGTVGAGAFGELRILLVSCYYRGEDEQGRIARQIAGLKLQPDLTLLMGDQVYLDLPTDRNFPNQPHWLARHFEQAYWNNWQPRHGAFTPGFGEVMRLAPWLGVADDHEFWNNAPHVSPIIQNSWKADGRSNWWNTALNCYRAFQAPAAGHDGQPHAVGDPYTFDIGQLSFFVADTRSRRDADAMQAMDNSALARLEQWVTTSIAQRRTGVIVTGQPLLQARAGRVGKITDYALADYGDYGRWLAALNARAAAGLPTVLLTGDVHYGRVSQVIDDRAGGWPAHTEVIASPTSLVRTLGADDWASINPLADPVWPRHSNGEAPPPWLSGDKRHRIRLRHLQKGDHVALLRFRPRGGALSLQVDYFPLHPDPTHAVPRRVSLDLTPRPF
ncbi:alkaline phosphatase D family protein [Chitiniphilus purpureus]|uniref:Alkaline phosphatase D family protein n=1 Tax=Chitiniphilus purpureus TaxID=2981137 RepID=A0ABY6DTG0_9NEIS|nr:alkaline phosphatase D family protein [Chitiniphilus sp. CD1]UXY16356.1 alkaline phosphatase D family protein [Chitiniphilus sp. CD1]